MHELELDSHSKRDVEKTDSLSKESWNPRACVYTDEANGITAGWKDSNNKPTFERMVTESFAGGSSRERTDFRGSDGKHYQVTEYDSDHIVRPEINLRIKQPGGNFSNPAQVQKAMSEYLNFKDELENGKLCEIERTNFQGSDALSNLAILSAIKDRNSLRELSNGDTVEQTEGTVITRSADGQKVTIEARSSGKESGRAEYTLARDKEGNEVCILRSSFPDGYKSQVELSADDFYAIRDSRGQTWQWLGDPKNHKFYIQGSLSW